MGERTRRGIPLPWLWRQTRKNLNPLNEYSNCPACDSIHFPPRRVCPEPDCHFDSGETPTTLPEIKK